MQSNSSQADKDRHVNEVQKRALETTALKELHVEMNSARKKEHTTTAVESLSDACAAFSQVPWDERCAVSQAHIFGHIQVPHFHHCITESLQLLGGMGPAKADVCWYHVSLGSVHKIGRPAKRL